MEDITLKTDRELMVMKVEMEQHLIQLQQHLTIVNQEIMKRVKETLDGA